MKLRTLDAPLADLEADALVVFRHEGAATDDLAFKAADGRMGGALGQIIAAGDFRGQAAEVLVVQAPGQKVKRVVLAGLGKPGKATLETLRNAAGRAAVAARDLGVSGVVVATPSAASVGWKAGMAVPSVEEMAQATAEGARLALYKLDYKKKDPAKADAKAGLTDIALLASAGDQVAAQRGIDTAQVLAEAIDATRTLTLQPGNWLTPAKFAEESVTLGESAGLTVEIFDEQELEKRGFTGIMAIARGSDAAPRMITLRWNGGTGAPIAIVGKGVTFDSGGIGIKPSGGMEKMKYDMAGGAATLGILLAAARLNLPLNIVGVIPAVENMPGERALCPNEIITMYGGLTAELVDTDCEGRVILADALAYAVKDLGASAIVDMATLTGAVGVALGREVCGVMGNHQGLVDALLAAGDRAGERGWQLPMWEEFDEAIKSDLADIKNYSGRDAGTITAAAFLKAFVGETPWVHLDIAGVAWTDADKGYRPKGPTGTPVRTVIELLRSWKSL